MKINAKRWLYFIPLLIGFFLGLFGTPKTLDLIVDRSLSKSGTKFGAWSTNLGLAQQDQSAILRAIVARIGLGANTAEEAIYLNAYFDDEGNRLSSRHNYLLTFENEPPVQAFWSLTAYNQESFLIENPFNFYGINQDSDLRKRPDGSFDILLSKSPPADTLNWIPLPEKDQYFNLTLRCYTPTPQMLERTEEVSFPSLKKIGL